MVSTWPNINDVSDLTSNADMSFELTQINGRVVFVYLPILRQSYNKS